MKVTGYNKYTGDIVYEVEVADCRPEHIVDVSQCVCLGECWAYINDIPTRTEFKDEKRYILCGGERRPRSSEDQRLSTVRRPGGGIMRASTEIERAGDKWQVRAIERDTGKLIVFPHVFDDPDEAAYQFARVCKSPHYKSVDIESVFD